MGNRALTGPRPAPADSKLHLLWGAPVHMGASKDGPEMLLSRTQRGGPQWGGMGEKALSLQKRQDDGLLLCTSVFLLE